MTAPPLAIWIFFATLLLTIATAIYARVTAGACTSEEDLAGRSLNKWLVGLSAATTGNSGFIVTGAVGVGYAGGAQWLLLPIGWLVGDLVYWAIFPARINRLARQRDATTIGELLTLDITGRWARAVSMVVASILAVFMSVYTSAQWLAGAKFLDGIFEITPVGAISAFSLITIIYSAIGGFRGSIYVDILQALIRIGGTLLALVSVIATARVMGGQFSANLVAAGPQFLDIFAGRSLFGAVAFTVGFAGAAIGFGLGQPQIISRYMAGQSPEETRSARWIYIGFLQFTWLSMTLFGILLRGVQPGIADPETGLSLYVQTHVGAVATGIILADVFATIAGTSNGLLVAIVHTIRRDLFLWQNISATTNMAMIVGLGVVTIMLSLVLPGNVYSIAVGAISMIGAALAAAMIIKIFALPHNGPSLLCTIVTGLTVSMAWRLSPLAVLFNETIVGIAAGLLFNALFVGKHYRRRKIK